MKIDLHRRIASRPSIGGVVLLGFVLALPLAGQIRQGFTGTAWKFPEFYESALAIKGQSIPLKGMLLGGEGRHLSNRVFRVKDMRLEQYALDGRTNLIARAPDCLFDQSDRVAWSTGALEIVAMDGAMFIEGHQGFQVRMTNSTLNISNRVRTVIQHDFARTLKP